MGISCFGSRKSFPSLVHHHEKHWVKFQPFLLQRGYKLRPRYDPTWKPSWKGFRRFRVSEEDCEDAKPLASQFTIDAIRMKDYMKVVIKVAPTWKEEIPIIQYLNSDDVRSDPRNKTVPVLDVIMLPRTDSLALIVMPMFLNFAALPFRYLGEVCDALEQFFSGLSFMHEHHIAHRDACYYNMMMDISRVVPNGFHFSHWRTEDGIDKEIQWVERRSVAPVNYYFIDFGLSHRFPEGTTDTKLIGIVGQDKTVPEASNDVPYDAFKLDIYQLGNVLPKLFNNYEGLMMFKPLSDAMTCRDPEQRPSASEAYRSLMGIISTLSEDDLNRRIWHVETTLEQRYRIEFCNENLLEYHTPPHLVELGYPRMNEL